jgi:endoglycosylceramidase
MNKIISVSALLIFLLVSCTGKHKTPGSDRNDLDGGWISVKGTRFVDSFGRQVILSGINKVNKDPKMNYTDNDSIETYEQFSKWGFNCIRLGVIWDGVEPKPGKYDEKYLDKLEEKVNWAAMNGIYVLLDMHQDLYSVLYSDGAPEWATLTEKQPHSTGDIWSDSYLISAAVQKAFDNFWANTPVADGIGVQDHYANMWQHVARRFAGNNSVIGYDIMNEPFNGTPGTLVVPEILSEYAKLYAEDTGKVLSESELLEMWSDEVSRSEALKRLENPEKFARVFDAGTELNQKFEKTALQSMYQRVANSIREADTNHILFIEHAYFGNTGISSGIQPLKRSNGEKDNLVAYAAHGYDLLVDTKYYDDQSNARVELIFSRINETSKRINLPVIVGEWGALSGNSEAMSSSASSIIGLFERFGFSNTFWAYYNGIERDHFFKSALIRPFPQYTGGLLSNYGFNRETNLFSCTWKESPDVNGSTVIYIPDIENLVRESISLNPERSSTIIQSIKSSKAGYLIIPVTGKSLSRTIEFKINNNLDSFSIEDKSVK